MHIHFVLHIHKQLFTVYHNHFMRTIIDEYPEIYLDELQEWMQHLTGKVSRRDVFRRDMSYHNREQFLFVDESSKDDWTFVVCWQ